MYPLPTTLVGAMVNEKPNYVTLAHVGIMDPSSVSLGMSKVHYTNAGIKEKGTFSINMPSVRMVKETDYCGLVSGKKMDKARLFKTFFGKLGTAPMIEECPVNMECKLVKTVDLISHDIFIGKVVATYCGQDIVIEGAVDLRKSQPILFSMLDRSYWTLGEKLASAWNIGNSLKNKK